MVSEAWLHNPILLFRERHSSAGKEVASILASFETKPAPLIIDLDERSDARVLTPILTRLTSAPRLPILLISGTSIPTSDLEALRQLDLHQLITDAGAVVGGGRKHKHGK